MDKYRPTGAELMQQNKMSSPTQADPYAEAKSDQDPYEAASTTSIPKTENLLQRAIRALTPQSNQEWSDVPNIGATATGIPSAYNALNKNPIAGFTEMGSKISGEPISEPQLPDFPEPNTGWGKEMNKFVGNVQLAVPLALGAKSLLSGGAQGIGKLFGEKSAKRGLEDIAIEGANVAKDRTGKMVDEATNTFGKGLDNMKETMTKDDFAQAISKSIEELGVGSIMEHPLNKILANVMENLGEVLNPREIQQNSKAILTALGNDKVSKAIFYKNLGEILPDSLKALKSDYAPIFNVMEQGKKLTKTNLIRAGKGTMGDIDLSFLKEAEDSLGLNLLQKAIKGGKNIDRARNAKKAAIGAAGLTTAGLGANFLKHLIKDQ